MVIYKTPENQIHLNDNLRIMNFGMLLKDGENLIVKKNDGAIVLKFGAFSVNLTDLRRDENNG